MIDSANYLSQVCESQIADEIYDEHQILLKRYQEVSMEIFK